MVFPFFFKNVFGIISPVKIRVRKKKTKFSRTLKKKKKVKSLGKKNKVHPRNNKREIPPCSSYQSRLTRLYRRVHREYIVTQQKERSKYRNF